jgi:hypothetical protein
MHPLLPPQLCDAEQTEHATPLPPHALCVVPDRHCPLAQQPPHDVLSHAQTPLAQ